MCAVLLTAGCRENQKEQVRELEAREAQTASAVTSQSRQEFQANVEEKLSRLKAIIDELQMKVASAPAGANPLLVKQISDDASQMYNDWLSLRMQFDELKTGSDEQFQAGRQQIKTRLDELQQRYNRFATGSGR
jgi:hypothetical protein